MESAEGKDPRPEHSEAVDEDLEAVYGRDLLPLQPPPFVVAKRTDFAPWHHPVKQIVRKEQWGYLTNRLLQNSPLTTPVLRYFTLPGGDLLDVRVLSEICEPLNIKIEYFGFDSSTGETEQEEGASAAAGVGGSTVESALRQAGKITDRALILQDRLEDIAILHSQAATQLQQREPFHVINLDACGHLTHISERRSHSIFDALKELLRHQLRANTPWLLFVTTRVDPRMINIPDDPLKSSIADNLSKAREEFGKELADAIGVDVELLDASLEAAWGRHDRAFVQLFSIGLGKFLLQYFNGQPNTPADVELASACAYRVDNDEPDMISLAFRISPEPFQAQPPSVGGTVPIPDIEPQRAARIARRVKNLRDLDSELMGNDERLQEFTNDTINLLDSAGYDIAQWRIWLANLTRRPIKLPPPT